MTSPGSCDASAQRLGKSPLSLILLLVALKSRSLAINDLVHRIRVSFPASFGFVYVIYVCAFNKVFEISKVTFHFSFISVLFLLADYLQYALVVS